MPTDETGSGGEDRTEAHVRKWLREKGVRLELDVAAAFNRQRGTSSVDHARFYIDEDAAGASKVREVDVVAQCASAVGQNSVGRVNTWFVVECKSSKGDPWVIYRSESTSRFIARDSRGLLRNAVQFLERGVSVDNLEERSTSDAFGSVYATGTYGYQIADTGEDASKDNGKRSAFSAVQQVLSAVDGAVRDVDRQASPALLSIFVPVIVTAAPLFAVDAQDDALALTRVQFVPLIARLRRPDALSLVWIVQADHLDEYVSTAVSGASALRVDSAVF